MNNQIKVVIIKSKSIETVAKLTEQNKRGGLMVKHHGMWHGKLPQRVSHHKRFYGQAIH